LCSVIVLSASSIGSSAPSHHLVLIGHLGHLRRGRVLALGEHLHDDVAVGQHALEPVVLAADRHRADVELSQLLRRVEHGVVLADARGVRGHDVASGLRGHVAFLSSGSADEPSRSPRSQTCAVTELTAVLPQPGRAS
jgi:hypothetical protein